MFSFALMIMILLYFSAPPVADCKQESKLRLLDCILYFSPYLTLPSLLDITLQHEYLQSLSNEVVNVTCEGNYTTEITKPHDKTCYGSKVQADCTATCNYDEIGSLRDHATANITTNVTCISEEMIKFRCEIEVKLMNASRTEIIIISLQSKTAPGELT